ncbi:MAG: DUF4157 domain-containing protein [Caldilineaceae bacterium]|nr:DUF4157 domain-containing protein [Caldilineaceae bacterium]
MKVAQPNVTNQTAVTANQGTHLQRKCACGGTPGPTGECAECRRKRQLHQAPAPGAGKLLQPKLRVNQPDDPFEREADRVADAVVQGSAVQPRLSATAHQREEKAATAAVAPPLVEQVVRSTGQTLDSPTRQAMEARFGHDFGQVQIHTDQQAAHSAAAVNARAYTVGNHIVFGAGQFAPAHQAGQRLLAHELTHVLQQAGSASPVTVQRDEEPKQDPSTTKQDPTQLAIQAVNTALAAIEANWQEIRTEATASELAAWVKQGDTVLALLQSHTKAALAASQAGDTALFTFYLQVVESDKIMYDFIAWQVVYFANLLALQPDMASLVGAFAADDRAFTGRADAEELVRLLAKLITQFSARAQERLKNVSTAESITVRRPGLGDLIITATNAYQAKNRSYFLEKTADTIQAQAELQNAIAAVNGFLVTARREGLRQAIDAVEQFFQMRGQIKGQGPKVKKSKGKGQGKGQQKGEQKKEQKGQQEEKRKKEEGEKKGRGGRWGCDDVRCNVYPDPQADPPNPACPERVIGMSRGHSSFAEACLAAQRHANAQVPRGCVKRHCNCNSKCRKM